MNTIEFTNENVISAMAVANRSLNLNEKMKQARFVLECLPLNITVTAKTIQEELQKKIDELNKTINTCCNSEAFNDRWCYQRTMNPTALSWICNSLEKIGMVKISKRKFDTPQPIIVENYDYCSGEIKKKIVGQYDTINEYTRIA